MKEDINYAELFATGSRTTSGNFSCTIPSEPVKNACFTFKSVHLYADRISFTLDEWNKFLKFTRMTESDKPCEENL